MNESRWLWLVFIPPLATLVALVLLLRALDGGGTLDAQEWPTLFRGPRPVPGSDDGLGIYRVFVFSTTLLVFLNNLLLYLRDIRKLIDVGPAPSSSVRRARGAAYWLGIISTVAVLAWVIDTPASFFPAESVKHEIFGLCCFLLFAIIDALLAFGARNTITSDDYERSRMRARAAYYRDQALFTDTPVVIGMATLLLVQIDLHHLPSYTHAFRHGFVSGSVAMHLAYSQFVFLILTFRFHRRLAEIHLEEMGRLGRKSAGILST